MGKAAEYWDATMTVLLAVAALAGFIYWGSFLLQQQLTPPDRATEEAQSTPKEVTSTPDLPAGDPSATNVT